MFGRRLFSTLANNYKPLPVKIVRGKDYFLYGDDGKKYIDLLAGYSAVNQGHCHPKIVEALINQSNKLTLPSRVVQNDQLENWANTICSKLNYDSVLPMNSGAEAVETALKLSRKCNYESWGKQNPYIICLSGNYHGRTLGTISLTDYEPYRENFGPFLQNILKVKFNDIKHLESIFGSYDNNIGAIIFEPIQGEGGVIPMTKEFYDKMFELKKYNNGMLIIADEIQTGLGRSGNTWTACETLFGNKNKPDILILGKALSGGMMPMSCILTNRYIMNHFKPGTHGSTFGGNPLACAVSQVALDVLEKECFPNVSIINKVIVEGLSNFKNNKIVDIRGSGAFWGIQFNKDYDLDKLQIRLLNQGYITCKSRNNTLRFTPPLITPSDEISKALYIINQSI